MVAGNKSRRPSKRKGNRGDDSLAEGLGGLHVRENGDQGLDPDGYDLSYSLIHSMLARRIPPSISLELISPVSEAVTAFLTGIELISSDRTEIQPEVSDVRFAFIMLIIGHASRASEFTTMYPMSSGMGYVRGRAYLELGDIASTVRNFEMGAAGCRGMSAADMCQTILMTTGRSVTSSRDLIKRRAERLHRILSPYYPFA